MVNYSPRALANRNAYKKHWRDTHRDHLRAWRQRNSEHLREYNRQYRQRNKVRVSVYNAEYRKAHLAEYRRYIKAWRYVNQQKIKDNDRERWRRLHGKGGEHMATFNKQKHYTLEEVSQIFADKMNGYSWSHLKVKYGRTRSGLGQLWYAYQQFQKGNKVSPAMMTIFSQLGQANGLSKPQGAGMLISVTKDESDRLARLESAFNDFQQVMVEVIEQEVKRRSAEWIKRAVEAETELGKYKEAAQQSSMVGALRRRWGIGA